MFRRALRPVRAVLAAGLGVVGLTVTATPVGAAAAVTGPGGVAGVTVWLKADTGIAVAEGNPVPTWNSATGTYFVAGTGGERPTYRTTTKLVNGNPTVEYNGSNGVGLHSYTRMYGNTSAWTAITVGRDERTDIGTYRGVAGVGVDGNYPAFDQQKDLYSPNGWNPWMSGSSPAEWTGGSAVLFDGNTGGTNQQPQIFGMSSANNGTNPTWNTSDNVVSNVDGFSESTTLDAYGQYEIGNGLFVGSSGDAAWVGAVPEVIVYSKKLSATEQARVNSYLAIKYGITIDQRTATDYLASDGTVKAWTAVNNTGFNKDIAVIGRDDAAGLNQKQSASVNATVQPTIGLTTVAATNAANPSVFAADKTFEAISSNGASSRYDTSLAGFAGLDYKMLKTWKVQETGTVGSVRVALPRTNGAKSIILSSDATIDATDTAITLTDDGTTWKYADINLTDGQYFTFAAKATGPGGIVTGLATWLKADAGITAANGGKVASWDDSSLYNYDLAQAAVASQPTYNSTAASKLVNFNPSVSYDGSDDYLINKTPVMSSSAPYTWFLTAVDEAADMGFRQAFTSQDRWDMFGMYKYAGGAVNTAGYNNWSIGMYGSPNYVDKSTKFGPQYGSNGYYTGTGYTTSSKTQNVQPQIIGLNSANSATTDALGQWVDGWKNTPKDGSGNNNSFLHNGMAYQPYQFASLAVGTDWSGAVPAESWLGRIPEVIAYQSNLSDADIQRINSYLAIKYGVTLGQGNGAVGSNGQNMNYLATDATIIWDASANSTYKNNIAGIGRDDNEALLQKQSMAVNKDFQITVGLGGISATNAANSGTFGADKSYLIWGDNGATDKFGTAFTGSAAADSRMNRAWRAQESGTVGSVRIALPRTHKGTHVVVSNDATFDGTDTMVALTDDGSMYKYADVNLTNGQYFTFAAPLTGPGGVIVNLKAWYRADSGITAANGGTVDTWQDSTPNAFDVSQPTVVQRPTFYDATSANLVNWNPTVHFDGTNGWGLYNTTRLFASSSPYTTYAVARDQRTDVGSGRAPMGMGSDGNYPGLDIQKDGVSLNGWNPWMTFSSPAEYGASNAVLYGGNPGGTNQQPQVYSLGSTNASTSAVDNITSDVDGFVEATSLDSKQQAQIGNNVYIGSSQDAWWNGDVPEAFVLAQKLSASDQLKVDSYLAVKYGITLDQRTPTSYKATDGSTIWDATANATYSHNIAAVGRDDAEDLNQKQSTSVNAGIQPTIGLTTIEASNAANLNNFSADKSYLVWGSDTGISNLATPLTGFTGQADYRMTRVWQANEVGTVGTVRVALPRTNPSTHLLLSADATFGAGDTALALTDDGTDWKYADVDLTSGQFFTFASLAVGPGGVVSGLATWLRGDSGIGATDGGSVTTWYDQSLANYNVSQTTTASKPVYYSTTPANLVNFNPAVKFDGSNDGLVNSTPIFASTSPYTFMAATVDTSADTGFRTVLSSQDTYDYMNLYKQGNSPGYVNWSWNMANSPVDFDKGTKFGPTAGSHGYWNGSAYTTDSTTANTQAQIVGMSAQNVSTLEPFDQWLDGWLNNPKNGILNNSPLYGGMGNQAKFFKNFSVGTEYNGSGTAEFWQGLIPEIVAYSQKLNASDQAKVNTYLAVKYGVTLGQGNGFVGQNGNNVDYKATDGTKIWDATANTAYGFNIAAIGRDDAELLKQRQSKSVNAGFQVAFGLGSVAATNAANTNNFAADKSYDVIGDNGALTTLNTAYTSGAADNKRMARIWKVAETGTVGTVRVAIPRTDAAKTLVVSANAVFDNTDTRYPLTDDGVAYKYADVDLTNGQFFTFAGVRSTPVAAANGFVMLDDGTNAPGARAWFTKTGGKFTTCSVYSGAFDRDTLGTEFAGDSAWENTFLADVTGDGLDDIVHVSEDNGNEIRVYKNKGDGSFATTASVTTGLTSAPAGGFAGWTGTESGIMADVDGNGFPDYVFGEGNNLHVWLNLGTDAAGNGWFANGSAINTTVINIQTEQATGFGVDEQVFLQDVNGDGLADWVKSNNTNRSIHTYLSKGDGTFATIAVQTLLLENMGANNSTGIGWTERGYLADVNNDGKLDYAEASDNPNALWVWFGKGDGSFGLALLGGADNKNSGFQTFTANFYFTGWEAVESGDFIDADADGKIDYVTSIDNQGNNNGLYMFKGNGDGTFAATAVKTIGGTANEGMTRFLTGHSGTESSFMGHIVPASFDLNSCGENLTAWAYLHGQEGFGLNGAVDVYGFNPDGTVDRSHTASTTDMLTAAPTMAGAFSSYESTFVLDVTGDGKADWVHLDDWNKKIAVWPGTGNGTFDSAHAIVTSNTTPTGGTVNNNLGGDDASERTFLIDVTQDGIADIVTSNTNTSNGTIDVYPGKGDGTFSLTGPKVKSTTGLKTAAGVPHLGGFGDIYKATFLKDVTGDGIPDWVDADDGSMNAVVTWPGKGDGTFETTPSKIKKVAPAYPTSSSLANNFAGNTTDEVTFLDDVTSDGIPDLVHCARTVYNGTVGVFPGKGDGTFIMNGIGVKDTTNMLASPVTTAKPADWFCSLHTFGSTFLADITGPAKNGPDGKLDIVYADDGTANEFDVWVGNGDGTFDNTMQVVTTGYPLAGAAALAVNDFAGETTGERSFLLKAASLFSVDHDNDGIPDSIDADDDNDGIPDTVENVTGCTPIASGQYIGMQDCDGDGIPNQFDPDDDGDGVPTLIESTDHDHNGIADVFPGIDANNNGMADNLEGATVVDTDSDGVADAFDTDDDGDGVLSKNELTDVAPANGIPDYLEAPTPPVITGPASGSTTNNTTPLISGTGVVGAVVTVKDAAAATVCTATVLAGGTWSCTPLTPLANGNQTMVARQVTGGLTSAPAATTFAIDTVPPATPMITSPANGAFTTGTPLISGTGEAGSIIDVKDGAAPVCSTTVAADGTWSCTAAPTLSSGGHTLTAVASDPAGNTATSTAVAITVDSTPPPLTVTAPVAASSTNDSTPTFSGTTEIGATVTVKDQATGATLCTDGPTTGTTWTCTPASSLADGTYTVDVIAADAAGNTTTVPRTFTVDTVAPSVPPVITAPAAGTTIATATPTLSGTAAEAGGTVTVTDSTGAVVCTGVVDASKNWTCTPTAPGLGDGSHTVTATQTDVTGNKSLASTPTTFAVDTTALAPVITAPAANSVTNDTTPTALGTGEPGATVTVLDNGAAFCTATVAADGRWSCTPATPITGASHSLTATQTDTAGNVSPASPAVPFMLDTTASAAPAITSPAAGASTNDTTPTFAGTGVAGEIVIVKDGLTPICTAVVDAAGNWSCNPTTPLAVGLHPLITATQTDPAGNTSPASSAQALTIDTTAPTAPAITSPAAGSTSTDATPTITGTGETGATVTVMDGTTVVCTAVVTAGAWSCTPVSPLAEGPHSLTAIQTDPAGNTSPESGPTAFTIDTIAPAAPVIVGPVSGSTTGDSTPTFSGTGEPGAMVTVYDGPTSVCTATVNAAGLWSCDAASPMANGSHVITATQTDPAGLASPASSPTTITVDTTSPVASPAITAPASGTTTTSHTPTISGTGTPGAAVTVKDGATTLCAPTVSAGGTWTCTPSTLADGIHNLTATQTVGATSSNPSATTLLLVDATVPAAPAITAPVSGSSTNDSTPTFSGTGEPGATVTVVDGGTTVCTAVVAANGTWSCTPSIPLADGLHTVTATQTDPSGNVSPVSAPTTLTTDTAAPAAPSIASPVAGSSTNDSTPTISGMGEVGATVTVTEGGTTVCSAVVAVGGTWTCTPATALADGTHNLTATQKDPAGNTSPASAVTPVTVDTMAPAAPAVTSPAAGSTVASGSPAISGTGEPGATVTVTDGGTTVCTAVVAAGGTWSCIPTTPLSDGPHNLKATQADPAGNVSPASPIIPIKVDTTAPGAPATIAPASGATLGDSTPSISGTGEPGATVTVMEGATTLCTAVVQPNGLWSCDAAPALVDGPHSITATQTDPAGNVSPATAAVPFSTATGGPASPVITGPVSGTSTNNPTPTLTGTGTPGATVTVTDGMTPVCTAVVSAAGRWTCTLTTPLTDGNHPLSATQSGPGATGTSQPSSAVLLQIDTTAPVAPAIAAPVSGSTTNDSTPAISGTGEPGAVVTVKDGLTTVCTATVGVNGTWTCTPTTPLTDGSHSLTATQTAPAGNGSPASPASTVTVDTTAPVAPAVTAPATGTVTNDATPTISGTGVAGATVTVTDNGNPICTAVVTGGGIWSCAPTNSLTDGTHVIAATQTDPAGNVSPASSPVSLSIDTTTPLAPAIISPVNGSSVKSTTPTLTGTGEPGATVTVAEGAGTVCSAVVDASGRWTCTAAPALGDGPHTITATQTDPAGNVSPASAPIAVTVDMTAPATPVIIAPAASGTTGPKPTVSGTGTPGSSVTVTDGAGGLSMCSATVDASGNWACTPTTPLTAGTHTLVATATDPASNTSTPSAGTAITVDTTAAAPAITGPATGTSTNNTTPTLGGTGEIGAIVTVKDVGGTTICNGLVDNTGHWTCDAWPALAPGTYNLTATQTDAVGNLSSASSPAITLTIDTTAPAAPVIAAPVSGSATGNTMPTFSGTAEAGSAVTVKEGATAICFGIADGTGAWSCAPVGPLADGAHTVTAAATDPAGNTGAPSAPTTVTVDTVGPIAPAIAAPADGGATNLLTPTVSGTGEPGATVTVTEGTTTLCTTTVLADGTWSCTVSPALTAGLHAVTATQTDPAGHTSSPATPSNFTIDTMPPAAPTVARPVPGAMTNDTTPTFTGTGEAGATVKVSDGATVICTAVVAADGSWTCTPTNPLGDGPHSISANQTDRAGNPGPSSAPAALTVDTSVPAAPAISAPAAGTITTDSTPTLSGTGEAGATVTVADGGNTVCTAVVDGTGLWTCTPTSPLADGTHNLTATQTDPAGNTSPAGSPVAVTIDATAPAAPVITGPVAGSTTGDNTPTVSGTGERGATVRVKDGTTVLCTTTVNAAGLWSCDAPSALLDGPHSLTATQTDTAGNQGPASAPTAVTVDTTQPTVPPTITTPVSASTTTDSTPTVSGTGTPGATVTVTEGATTVCSATVVAAGTWTCDATVPMTDGIHTLSARQTVGGNTSVASATVTVAVDATVPAAPAISAPAAGSATSSPTPVISGTGEPGAVVTVTDGGSTVCTATVAADGTWSCTPAGPLAEGAHNLTATQTDPAGNGSPVSAGTPVTVDTMAPAAPSLTGPTAGSITSDSTPTISGLGEVGATVTVTDGGSIVCTALVTAAGTWTCDASPALTDGSHNLAATQKDAAGNVSPVSGVTPITVDTVAPVAPMISGPGAGSTTGDSTPTITGTGEPGATVTVKDGTTTVCTTTVSVAGIWSCDAAPALGDGPHSLTATQKDSAGNTSTATPAVPVTVDITAPAAPVISAPAAGSTVGDSTPTITGTGEPGATVTVKDGATTVCTTTVQPNGTWSCDAAPALVDGPHSLSATQTDPAGHPSPVSPAASVTVDTTGVPPPTITGPASGTSTSDNTPTLTGTGTPGAAVAVKDGATTVCTATVLANGTWSCTAATPLSEGNHPLTSTQTTGAGTSPASSPVLVNVDTVAPAAPAITAPTAGNTTNDSTPTISGTGEPGATVKVTDAGNTVCTTIVLANGTWSCTANPLGDGNHNLVPTQTDPAGNVGPAGASIPVVIDTIAPAAPAIIAPAVGSSINDSTPTVTGTGVLGSTVTVTDNGHPVCTTTVAADGTWSCTLGSALPDGTHLLAATQTDPAGNTSSPSVPVSTTVDTVAPVAPAVAAPAAGSSTNNPSPTISGTGEPGALVTVTNGATPVCTATVAADGTWSCIPAAPLADGLHPLTTVQTDPAGNTSPASTPKTIIVDTVAPATPTLTAPITTPTNDITPTLSGSGDPGSTVTVKEGATVLCAATVDAAGLWACTPATPLAEGAHPITVSAVDAAGNASTSSTPVTVTIDTTAPVAPVITTPAAGGAINGTTPTFTGTGEIGATVTMSDGATAICSGVVNAAGVWSCTPVSPLTEGLHSISAKQTDPAGNIGSASAAQALTVDTVAPAVPLLTAPTAGTLTSDTTPTFTGTGEPGATVTVSDGAATVCSGVVDSAGNWTCTPAAALADAAHNFAAAQTDPAGNSSPSTAPIGVTTDGTAPAAPVVNPTNGNLVNGTAEPGSTVTVKNGATTVCTAVATAAGTWSCSPTPAPANGDTLSVTAKDAAGNTSLPTTTVVDTSLAPAPVVNPTNGSAVSGTATPGSTVTVTGPATQTCTATADAAGLFSCTLTPAAGHGTTVSVVAITGGNISNPATAVVDAVAPTAPIVNPSNGATVSGTAEAGSTVTVKDLVTGVTLCTTTATVAGTFSCVPLPTPADGTILNVIATDASSNPSPVTPVTVDAVAPAAPVVQPTNGAAVSGTAEAGSTVTVKDLVTGVTLCTTTATAIGTFSCVPLPTPIDGTTLQVKATDVAGNNSPSTSVVVDSVAPAAPAITVPALGSASNNPSAPISGAGEPGATVTVTDGGTQVCTAVVTAAGTWSCIPTIQLIDGPHVIIATQKDAAGNTSIPSAPANVVTVDTVAPVAPIVVSPTAGSSVPTTTPTFTGSGEAGATVTVADGATTVCTALVTVAGTWSCTPPNPLTEGSHSIGTTQTDKAGNTSPGGTLTTVTVDTTVPVAPVISSPATGAITNNPTPAVSGTGEPGAVVTVKDGAIPVCTATVAANGTWTCSPAGLSNGSHSLTAVQTDAAGNTSPATPANAVTVDTVAPAPPVMTTPAPATTVPTTTPTFAGTGEAGATVSIIVGGVTLCSTAVAANGTWTCAPATAAALAEGPHTVTSTQIDTAGNTSAIGTPLAFTVAIPRNASITGRVFADLNFNGIPDGTETDISLVDVELWAAGADGIFGTSDDVLMQTATTHSPYQFTGLADGSYLVKVVLTSGALSGYSLVGSVVTIPVTVLGQTAVVTAGFPFVARPTITTPGITAASPTIRGTGAPGSTVTAQVDGGAGNCTVVVDADGSWSCTLAGVTGGNHKVTITETAPDGRVLSIGVLDIMVAKGLPATGSNTLLPLELGMALSFVGAAIVLVSRRRRRTV